MNFKKHYELKDKHSTLSASQHAWVRYTPEKMADVYTRMMAKQRGTKIHEFAAQCIELGQKLPRANKTLNMYVNDAIGFKMHPEVVLYYSPNCFGTADAILFRNNKLRIHDLKTGVTPAHFEQLMVYAAYFCLEYDVKPGDIEIELRLYQCDEVRELIPEVDDIVHIMDTIVQFDTIITKIQLEESM